MPDDIMLNEEEESALERAWARLDVEKPETELSQETFDESKHPRGQPENKGQFVDREDQGKEKEEEEEIKPLSQDQAIEEMQGMFPDSIKFIHGKYDSDEADGIYTDSQGGKWAVTVDFGNSHLTHRIK